MNAVANRTIERAFRGAVMGARLVSPSATDVPWNFGFQDDVLDMFLSPGRPSALDPDGRVALQHCGTALLAARAVLARDELVTTVTRFPDGPTGSLFARIRVRRPADPDEPLNDERLGSLCDCLRILRYNVGATGDVDLPRTVATRLAAVAAQEDALLVRVARSDHLAWLRQMHRHVERLLGPAAEPWPIPDHATPGGGVLPKQRGSTASVSLLLLGTRHDEPPAWLRSGEVLLRVRLELARLGCVTRPLTAWSAIPEARAAVRRGLSLNFHPQALFRVVRHSDHIEPF